MSLFWPIPYGAKILLNNHSSRKRATVEDRASNLAFFVYILVN